MKFILVFILAACLSACTGTTSVFTKKSVLVEIPQELLEECATQVVPLNPEEFKKLTLDLKIKEIHRASTEVFAVALRDCNDKIKSIKDWQEEQKKIINKE